MLTAFVLYSKHYQERTAGTAGEAEIVQHSARGQQHEGPAVKAGIASPTNFATQAQNDSGQFSNV